MHPFHESTVTHTVLYTVGFGIPIVSMILTEFIRWKSNIDADRELKLFGKNIPVWVQHVYKFIGILAFGAACSQLTTDIAKYTIGRLRPHFISVILTTKFNVYIFIKKIFFCRCVNQFSPMERTAQI